jgi:transposase
LKNKQDEEEYREKCHQLEQLFYLEETGFITLYYGDQSGFSLTPCIPYGWQPPGQYLRLPTQKGGALQVFGLLSRQMDFQAYTSEQSINSDLLIAFIDDFLLHYVRQPTVIVLDNAPIHHSEAFEDRIADWQKQDLYIFFLPRYSPHLNLIEHLWRKMKYEWLRAKDYVNKDALRRALDHILTHIGDEFTIEFHTPKMSIIHD